ncbi:hypothetical protein AeNC1_009774, partial [Aphanomyces euteiches]
STRLTTLDCNRSWTCSPRRTSERCLCGAWAGACAGIAAVLPSSTIVDLDLSGNHLTDRSADELCRVIQSDMALMSLRLSHNRITLQGETDLKKALAVRPQLKIFLDESGTPIKAMDQDDLVKIDF